MKECIVIGGGPAGLGAAIRCAELGIEVEILEKGEELGGILPQCIHDGFGIKLYSEAISGPEFAERLISRAKDLGVPHLLNAYVRGIRRKEDFFELEVISPKGAQVLKAKSLIFATGCRERHMFEIKVGGFRPAGVFTAGMAQRLINIYGVLPGKHVVIVGGGDIGLIVARHLVLEGASSVLIVEIMDKIGGLPRNFQQCVLDFGIPYRTRTTVREILGKRRVEGVILQRVDENFRAIPGTEERYPCDSVIFSVGLIPCTDLLEPLGVKIDPRTKGPEINEYYETSVPGVFAAGNLVQVFDFVDDAVLTGMRAAEGVKNYLEGKKPEVLVKISCGPGIRSVIPQRIEYKEGEKVKFYLRVLLEKENAKIGVFGRSGKIFEKFSRYVRPAVMEELELEKAKLFGEESVEFRLEGD